MFKLHQRDDSFPVDVFKTLRKPVLIIKLGWRNGPGTKSDTSDAGMSTGGIGFVVSRENVSGESSKVTELTSRDFVLDDLDEIMTDLRGSLETGAKELFRPEVPLNLRSFLLH